MSPNAHHAKNIFVHPRRKIHSYNLHPQPQSKTIRSRHRDPKEKQKPITINSLQAKAMYFIINYWVWQNHEFDANMPVTVFSGRTPSRQKRRQLIKQNQIERTTIISTKQKTAIENPEYPATNFQLGTCSSDVHNQLNFMFCPITKRQSWLWERPIAHQIQNLIKTSESTNMLKHICFYL